MYDISERITDARISKDREALASRRRKLKNQEHFLLKTGWAVTMASLVLFLLSIHSHRSLWLLWSVLGTSIPIGAVAMFVLSARDWNIQCGFYQLRLENNLKLTEEFCQISPEARKLLDDIHASGRRIYQFDSEAMLEAAVSVLAETSPAARAVRNNKVNARLRMSPLVFSRMRKAQLEELASQ